MSSRQSTPVAVVLAAGVGRRLSTMTSDKPKALVEVGGVALLERSLRALEANGFADIVVVTGYHADAVDRFIASRPRKVDVRTLLNPRFAETNNIVSLLAAEELLTSGFCLLNSDIVFDPSLLEDVRQRSAGAWLVVDRDEPLGDEEMKVQLDEDGTILRVSKQLNPAVSHGEFVGIARFDAAAAQEVLTSASDLVAAGRTNLYYEDAIDHAADKIHARVIPTDRRLWTEIDDLADFQRAQAVAAQLDTTSS